MRGISDTFHDGRMTVTSPLGDRVSSTSPTARMSGAHGTPNHRTEETFTRERGPARPPQAATPGPHRLAGLEPPRLVASLASRAGGLVRTIEVRDQQRPRQRLVAEREVLGNTLTPRRVQHYNQILAGLSDEEIETLVAPWTRAEKRVDAAERELDALRPAAAEWIEGTHEGEVLPPFHSVYSEDAREAQRQAGDVVLDTMAHAGIRGFAAGAKALAQTSYRWLSPIGRFAGLAMAAVDLVSLVRAPSRSQAAIRAARLAGGIGSLFFWPLAVVPIALDYVTLVPRSTDDTPITRGAKDALERATRDLGTAKEQTAENIVARVLPDTPGRQ